MIADCVDDITVSCFKSFGQFLPTNYQILQFIFKKKKKIRLLISH